MAASSEIEAVRLDTELVQGDAGEDTESRRVNFNSASDIRGDKFAVRILKISGEREPDPAKTKKDPNPTGDAPTQYAYTWPGTSPGTVLRCRIFPDRMLAMVKRMEASMQEGLDHPESEDGQLLAQTGIPPDQVRRALAAMTDAVRQQRVKTLVALCAIHEMGHACGLQGHVGTNTAADGRTLRNRTVRETSSAPCTPSTRLSGGASSCSARSPVTVDSARPASRT